MGCASSVEKSTVIHSDSLVLDDSYPDVSLKDKRAIKNVAPVKVEDGDENESLESRSRTNSCSSAGGLNSATATPVPEFQPLKMLAISNPEAKKALVALEQFEARSEEYARSLSQDDEYSTYGKATGLIRELERTMKKIEGRIEDLKRQGKFRIAEASMSELLRTRLKYINLKRRQQEESELYELGTKVFKQLSLNYETNSSNVEQAKIWREIITMFETWPRYSDLCGNSSLNMNSRQASMTTTASRR